MAPKHYGERKQVDIRVKGQVELIDFVRDLSNDTSVIDIQPDPADKPTDGSV